MELLTAALLLAMVALGLGIAEVLRQHRRGLKSTIPMLVLVVAPAAGIIGIVPGVLRLSETVRVLASIASSIISIGVIAMVVAHLARKRPA